MISYNGFLVYIGGITLKQGEIGQKVSNPCFLTRILCNYFYQLEKINLKRILVILSSTLSLTLNWWRLQKKLSNTLSLTLNWCRLQKNMVKQDFPPCLFQLSPVFNTVEHVPTFQSTICCNWSYYSFYNGK